jgi:hypothetical protein
MRGSSYLPAAACEDSHRWFRHGAGKLAAAVMAVLQDKMDSMLS